MTARISKTYTLVVTKIIVIDTDGSSFAEASAQTHKDLLSGLYQEQWAKARAQIDLVQVGAVHG